MIARRNRPSGYAGSLPISTNGVDGSRLIQARNADWIRRDIMEHSQGMSEDDFRAAVKRIRERKEREREEEAKAKGKDKPIASSGGSKNP